METTVEPLIADLLEFVAGRERTYEDVLESWRTSCPKLPVWEEANERGLIARKRLNGHAIVGITPAGEAFLKKQRTSPRC